MDMSKIMRDLAKQAKLIAEGKEEFAKTGQKMDELDETATPKERRKTATKLRVANKRLIAISRSTSGVLRQILDYLRMFFWMGSTPSIDDIDINMEDIEMAIQIGELALCTLKDIGEDLFTGAHVLINVFELKAFAILLSDVDTVSSFCEIDTADLTSLINDWDVKNNRELVAIHDRALVVNGWMMMACGNSVDESLDEMEKGINGAKKHMNNPRHMKELGNFVMYMNMIELYLEMLIRFEMYTKATEVASVSYSFARKFTSRPLSRRIKYMIRIRVIHGFLIMHTDSDLEQTLVIWKEVLDLLDDSHHRFSYPEIWAHRMYTNVQCLLVDIDMCDEMSNLNLGYLAESSMPNIMSLFVDLVGDVDRATLVSFMIDAMRFISKRFKKDGATDDIMYDVARFKRIMASLMVSVEFDVDDILSVWSDVGDAFSDIGMCDPALDAYRKSLDSLIVSDVDPRKKFQIMYKMYKAFPEDIGVLKDLIEFVSIHVFKDDRDLADSIASLYIDMSSLMHRSGNTESAKNNAINAFNYARNSPLGVVGRYSTQAAEMIVEFRTTDSDLDIAIRQYSDLALHYDCHGCDNEAGVAIDRINQLEEMKDSDL